MKTRGRSLLVCLIATTICFFSSISISFSETVIDTFTTSTNGGPYQQIDAQIYGGTFVASEERLKEFTIRIYSAGVPPQLLEVIILETAENGQPLADSILWRELTNTSEHNETMTFYPDVPLMLGKTYFIGLDFRNPDISSSSDYGLWVDLDNRLPDGEFWVLTDSGWGPTSDINTDIATIIVMSTDDVLFKETFVSHPVGQLYLPDNVLHTLNSKTGPAEVGILEITNALLNPPYQNQMVVEQDGSGIPGRSLKLSFIPISSTDSPMLKGIVTPPPVGDLNHYGPGVYEVSWIAAPNASSTATGVMEVYGWVDSEVASEQTPLIFQLVDGPGSPNYWDEGFGVVPTGVEIADSSLVRYRLLIDTTSSLTELTFIVGVYDPTSATWSEQLASAPPPAFSDVTSIDSIRFRMLGVEVPVVVSHAISNLRIVKLNEDVDGDGVANADDNCPYIANIEQDDSDDDGVGDVCDVCPSDYDPDQGDQDRDGVGDVCDNCPSDYTQDQSDLDSDGLGDVCDIDPMIEEGMLGVPEPTGKMDFYLDAVIDLTVQWPPDTGDPTYVIAPDCYNVQFEVTFEEQDGSIVQLSPNCLYPPAYNIEDAVLLSTDAVNVFPLQCDLTERFPQLAELPLENVTIKSIAYESFITDPWVDPSDGVCLDSLSGIVRVGGCKDVWVGRVEFYQYEWDGFFSPIETGEGVINTVKAGRAIPVKFSLGGDQGLDIFKEYPSSKSVTFTSSNGSIVTNLIDGESFNSISSAGDKGLSYDPQTDQYTFIWKTEKGWADMDRLFQFKLKDGSIHAANFRFTKK